MPGLIFMFL
uniref:Uncharacterized protein n=1 Tax=Anguilla anguilla TaxID=7936 RepID=A0A0E9VLB5_ANGAN